MLTSYEIERFVSKDHPYREILKVLDLKSILPKLEKLYCKRGRPGIHPEKSIKMLILQYIEDLSDRQMETYMQDSLAGKYFVGYQLEDKTPDHSFFGDFRKRLGTKLVADIFNMVVAQMEDKGVSGDVFTFIDSTAITSKVALWKERDKAIKDGLDKLNNRNVNKYSADKDAKFGCKGKNKFWFGFKRHHAVDMKSGVIKKVVVTPANIPDGKALKYVCPKDSGMIFADKAYSDNESKRTITGKGCYPGGVIDKNNCKTKNKYKDKWTTKVRMPYEGVFSKLRTRTKYRGQVKVQFQAFMEATVYNLKRWIKIEAEKSELNSRVVPCLT